MSRITWSVVEKRSTGALGRALLFAGESRSAVNLHGEGAVRRDGAQQDEGALVGQQARVGQALGKAAPSTRPYDQAPGFIG